MSDEEKEVSELASIISHKNYHGALPLTPEYIARQIMKEGYRKSPSAGLIMEKYVKIMEALEIGIVMAEQYAELAGPMLETYNQDVLKMIQAKEICSKFGRPKSMSVELLKELKLLKSYFEDTWEVVLHKKDINWKPIDEALKNALDSK